MTDVVSSIFDNSEIYPSFRHKTPKRINKMPPKKKDTSRRVSAPPDRVYKSSAPLQQTPLPEKKQRVKSYGKHSAVRIPKDNTLTQMDWVKRMMEAQDGDEEEGEDYVERQSKRRSKRRRKTTGDQPSTPQYHTQTMTQLVRNFSSIEDEPEEQVAKPEEPDLPEVHEDRSIYDVPSSSQSFHHPRDPSKLSMPPKNQVKPPRNPFSSKTMPPPQTPRRILPLEIPSSQSPATPVSLSFRSSTQRSPLQEYSNNTPIPFNTNPKSKMSPTRPPKLEIEDTFDSESNISQWSRVPSSPQKRSSPAKSVRFMLPDVEEENSVTSSPSIKKEPALTQKEKVTKLEILDSDAESEDDIEELELELEEEESQVLAAEISQDLDDQKEIAESEGKYDKQEPETCYGGFGLDTQFEAERILSSSRQCSSGEEASPELRHQSNAVNEETQTLESQRLATQFINSMAPRTADSDVFISVHPQQVTNLLNRTKNHETRNWSLPPTVCRIWIYETAPVRCLKYMAEIGSGKCPGEILDLSGSGNAEFNAKRGSWRAYEILQLYELAEPLSLDQLITNEWLNAAPTKFAKVRPAVLDQLMANLTAPLFDTEEPASSSTDTQEAEEQLMSTIRQFTQPAMSPQLHSDQLDVLKKEETQEVISQQSTPRTKRRHARPLSQATTVDLSQTQTPRHQSVTEIIWESPTRPVPSSPSLRLPTPHHSDHDDLGPESLVPFSMASSQLLTKSQLLPHSLLTDNMPGPAPFIYDTEDEDS